MSELFDTICRTLANPVPRRQALRSIIGAFVGAAVTGLRFERVMAQECTPEGGTCNGSGGGIPCCSPLVCDPDGMCVTCAPEGEFCSSASTCCDADATCTNNVCTVADGERGCCVEESRAGFRFCVANTLESECPTTPGRERIDWIENDAACITSQCDPTAIELISFTAKPTADGNVTLAWETATEMDNAGFNLYRARALVSAMGGSYIRINDALIPAEGDAVTGASYSFTDSPGYGSFHYMLEDLDYNGVNTLHGPVQVQVRPSWLPEWLRR